MAAYDPKLDASAREDRRQHTEMCTRDANHYGDLLEALRGLRVAEPELGFKPLLAKLREQQPDLGAATKEVREALTALKAESEASEAAAAQPAAEEGAPPAAEEGVPPAADEGGAPLPAALSLACAGCAAGCRRRWTTSGRSTLRAASASSESCRRRTGAAPTAPGALALGSCTWCITRR